MTKEFSAAELWAQEYVTANRPPEPSKQAMILFEGWVDKLVEWTGNAVLAAFEAGAASAEPHQVGQEQRVDYAADLTIPEQYILRAQLLGEPLPEPKAHAQFKLRPPRQAASA